MTTQPTQLVALYPYLFVIVKNYLYVYNLTSLTRIQRIPLEGRFRLTPNDSTACASFFLYSQRTLYSLSLLSPDDQIALLLAQTPPQFDKAIAVATNHGLDSATLRHLHLHYAYYLFSQSALHLHLSPAGLFDEAVQHFTQSQCAAQQVLAFLPELKIPSVSSTSRSDGGITARMDPENPYPVPPSTASSRRRAYEAVLKYLQALRTTVLAQEPARPAPAAVQTLTLVDTVGARGAVDRRRWCSCGSACSRRRRCTTSCWRRTGATWPPWRRAWWSAFRAR